MSTEQQRTMNEVGRIVKLNAARSILARATNTTYTAEQLTLARGMMDYEDREMALTRKEVMTEQERDLARHYELRSGALRLKLRAAGIVTERELEEILCFLLVQQLDPNDDLTLEDTQAMLDEWSGRKQP